MMDTHQSTPKILDDHFAMAVRYGERWQRTLYPALKDKTHFAMLYNRYAPLEDFHHVAGSAKSLQRLRFPSATDNIQADNLVCFVPGKDNRATVDTPPAPEKASNGLFTHYNVDAALVLVIHILQVLPGDNVLDLCATQGASSITLAQSIWPYLQPDSPTPPLPGAKKGTLHSNEVDPTQNRRLTKTLAQYLPASLSVSGQQEVIQVDSLKGASELPLGVGGYDKVFVDAPCSDERRIVQAQAQVGPGHISEELARWRPNASERLAEMQTQLLVAALSATRIGGRVVYSTRSISREENDDVIEKALGQMEGARSGNSTWRAEVESLNGEVERSLEAEWAEKTAKGWIVLPDRPEGSGWGPRYFCVLTKKSG